MCLPKMFILSMIPSMFALRDATKSVPHGGAETAQTATDPSGRREVVGIVVVFLWNRGDLDDAVRIEVHDERAGARFVRPLAIDEERPRPLTTRPRWSVSDLPWRLDAR
jgi:hypothetical protein